MARVSSLPGENYYRAASPGVKANMSWSARLSVPADTRWRRAQGRPNFDTALFLVEKVVSTVPRQVDQGRKG